MNPLYFLFSVTIFLSSFLLFQVQPLIGKHILPWFGGSSAVWITAMLFFMVALACGYIYAQLLSRLRIWYQAITHIAVIICTVVFIKENVNNWPSAITPNISDLTLSLSDPAVAVFKTLIITIGLPFVLLSSSSTLLQLWYGKLSGREPFSLYGISNIGSLLGLLSYPLFFERFFSTYAQGQWWTYGFITYVGLLLFILYILILFQKRSVAAAEGTAAIPVPAKRDFLVWTGIAAVPVMAMLAGTSFMTTAIAPVPFLWVGPLALYLLSFVVTFQNRFKLPFWTNELLVMFTVMLAMFLVVMKISAVWLSVLIIHAVLFAIYHWCHENLYALRPATSHLAIFYVALSIGGILGSLVIKIFNSYLLVMPIELMLLFVGSVVFITYKWYQTADYYIPVTNRFQLRLLSSVILVGIAASSSIYLWKTQSNVITQERNFFGYKAVLSDGVNDEGEEMVLLKHGMTNHGFQVYINDEPQILPVSYYSLSSGIGMLFSYTREVRPEAVNVAIAGLGSGGLLAYCLPSDKFTFFEIDPQIIKMAKENFIYIKSCPQVVINLSDARLGFNDLAEQSEIETKYDLIILDAYADDAMPIHLMTSEAINLYKSLLTEQGVLAVHISSRYLDLLPVIKAIAKDNDMSARYYIDSAKDSKYGVMSVWTALAASPDVFENSLLTDLKTFDDIEKEVLWTDTFSALLPVVKF